MEKIKSVKKKNEVVDYYSLVNNLSIDDIPQILDSLSMYGISFSGFRLSNNEEQPFHFFRTFSSKEEFDSFLWDDEIYIDDFGIFCKLNGANFAFSFDFSRDFVLTFSDGKMNFEPYLNDFERIAQKKTK